MRSEKEIEFIKEFINEHKDAKIFLGADSQRVRKKRVKFATVIVIHFIDENGIGKGAKVFEDVIFEDIHDAKLSRPFQRMMREVSLVTEVYAQLEDVLIDREFEVHLDVSPDEKAGSNVAYGAARGYIWGMIGVEPVCKPFAWCASTTADKYTK